MQKSPGCKPGFFVWGFNANLISTLSEPSSAIKDSRLLVDYFSSQSQS